MSRSGWSPPTPGTRDWWNRTIIDPNEEVDLPEDVLDYSVVSSTSHRSDEPDRSPLPDEEDVQVENEIGPQRKDDDQHDSDDPASSPTPQQEYIVVDDLAINQRLVDRSDDAKETRATTPGPVLTPSSPVPDSQPLNRNTISTLPDTDPPSPINAFNPQSPVNPQSPAYPQSPVTAHSPNRPYSPTHSPDKDDDIYNPQDSDVNDEFEGIGTQISVVDHHNTQATQVIQAIQTAQGTQSIQDEDEDEMLSKLQTETLKAFRKGIYHLARFYRNRDREDRTTKQGPSMNEDVSPKYILSLWYFSEEYLKNIITGKQDEIFASIDNPENHEAVNVPNTVIEGMIYGNFLGGPSGESACVGHLKRIEKYFSVYLEDVVAEPDGKTVAGKQKWKVYREIQNKQIATIVHKIDWLAKGRRADAMAAQKKAKNVTANAQAKKQKGSAKNTKSIQHFFPTLVRPGQVNISDDDEEDDGDGGSKNDDDDDDNDDDNDDDVDDSGADISEGSLPGSEQGKLVLKTSRRRSLRSQSKLVKDEEIVRLGQQ